MQKLFILLFIVTTSLGLIVLKLGTSKGLPVSYIDNKLVFNINLLTIAGIILYGISFTTYIYLLSRYDLGYIIPLVSAFVYLIIFVASYFIFKESFTPAKIAGITMIIVGLILLQK